MFLHVGGIVCDFYNNGDLLAWSYGGHGCPSDNVYTLYKRITLWRTCDILLPSGSISLSSAHTAPNNLLESAVLSGSRTQAGKQGWTQTYFVTKKISDVGNSFFTSFCQAKHKRYI